MFKNLLLKILKFFGLTLLKKTNIIDSKTLNFKMEMARTNLYIKPVISIDMIFDGYLYAFEFNVWYHDDVVVNKILTIGHNKAVAYRFFKDFDIPELLKKFFKDNDAERINKHIDSVVDKYTIDCYTECYKKRYSNRKFLTECIMNSGVVPIGTLYLTPNINYVSSEEKDKTSKEPIQEVWEKFGGDPSTT